MSEQVNRSRDFYLSNLDKKAWEEKCLLCKMVDQELRQQERVLFENTQSVAFIPFSSAPPYEIWVTPKSHAIGFEKSSDAELASLSEAMFFVLRGMKLAFNNPPYNYILYSAPFRQAEHAPFFPFHFYFKILPAIGVRVPSYEQDMRRYITPIPPEERAIVLTEKVREIQQEITARTLVEKVAV